MIEPLPISTAKLAELQRAALHDVDECVVGALIANAEGRIFAQKRSLMRRLFPGCWDIAGGHVERGESLEGALVREVYEETGWQIRLVELLHAFDWNSVENGRTVKKREFDFLVEAQGDLAAPKLEVEKHTEFRWFGPDGVEVLTENRAPGDTAIRDLVVKALTRVAQQSASK